MRPAHLFPFAAVLLLLAPGLGAEPSQQPEDPDEATYSSSRLKIPEPMVFDLVRPLGAPKGEVEVNSLFRMREFGEGAVLQWAPEIEYTFADGWGVEFELPLENTYLEAYKFALQGKFGALGTKSTLQGWQGIYEWERGPRSPRIDLLHLFGWQINPEWSFFSMNGVRRSPAPEKQLGYLGNHTVFRRFSSRLEIGLETNTHAAPGAHLHFMVMPQVLYRLGSYNIQAGVGSLAAEDTSFKVAWRISREF